MADFCTECGRQLSRFKTNNGHMDNCPTLYENQPSVGRGRKPQHHDSDWTKAGRMKVHGDYVYSWRCTKCGKRTQTTTDSPPTTEQHRGAAD